MQNKNEKLASERIIARENEKQFDELVIIKKTLIASESRYRRLFESAKDGILILDAETGMITDVNPFLIELLGYTKEQFLEKEIWEIGFFKDIIANREKFLELKQNKYVRYENLPLEAVGGKKINVEFVSNVYIENHQKVIQCNIRDITERKKTEDEIISQSNLLAAIFESSPYIMFLADSDGIVSKINKSGAIFVDKIETEIQNKLCGNVFSCIHSFEKFGCGKTSSCPDCIVRKSLNKSIRTGESVINAEGIMTCKAGNEEHKINILVSSNLIKLKDVNKILITIIDITERKLAENAMQQSEERFRAVFEQAGVGVAILNTRTGQIVRVNQKYCDFVGYTMQEMLQKTFMDITFHEDIQTNINNNIQLIEGSNKLFSFEKRCVHKNGNILWGILTVSPLWKPDEKPQTYFHIAIVENITERKLIETTLRESEAKFSLAFKTSPYAITITEPKTGKIVEVNNGFFAIAGYSPEEAIGKSTIELNLWNNEEDRNSVVRDLQNNEIINNREYCFNAKSGKLVYGLFSAQFIQYKNNTYIISSINDITERRQAEESLRESEEKFRSYIENAPDGIFVVNENGKYIEVNKAACQITGYSEDELLNMTIIDIIPHESLEEAGNNFSNVVNTGRSFGEFYYKHKNGTNRLWAKEAVKVSDARFLCFVKDITERKQCEVLAEANYSIQTTLNAILRLSIEDIPLIELLKQTFDLIINIPSLNIESKGCIFLVNETNDSLKMVVEKNLGEHIKQACELIPFGFCHCGRAASTQEIQFSSCIDEIHEISYEGIHDHGHYCTPIVYMNKTLGVINVYLKPDHVKNKTEIEFLFAIANTLAGIIVRKNNETELRETLENLENIVSIRTKDVEIKNRQLLDEIEERIEIEEGLALSEEKYRTLIELAVDAILIGDTKGNFINANRAASVLTGYESEELFNMNMMNLFSKEVLIVNPLRYHFLNQGEIIVTERMLTQKSGMLISIEMKTRRMPDGNYQTFMRDMTVRNKLEESIRDSLEKEKELNLLKTRFISVISHEFRTPLAGISGSVQLLEKHGNKWNDAKKTEYYKRIYSSIQYANVLLDDVSIIGKDDSGQLSAKIQAVNINMLCTEVIYDLKAIHGELTKIELQNNCLLEEINTDKSHLRHILNNLISNGIKYSDKKTVDLIVESDGSANIKFIVQDYGIGIPAIDQKHLFEPFHRASNVEGIKGTGLGLTIVKRCVDLLKGTIEIESVEGKGTRVMVVLPTKI